MPAYRTYLIDQTNNISGPAHWTICAGDFDAIEKAKQLVDGHDVELWESDRLVMRFFTTQAKSKELSNMATICTKERLERLFRWKQDGVKALSEYGS